MKIFKICVLAMVVLAITASPALAKTGTLKINIARTAFILADFDNDCCAKNGKIAGSYKMQQERGTIKNTQAALQASRDAGVYIVHIAHETRPVPATVDETFPNVFAFIKSRGALVEGTGGSEIIPELAPALEEPVVIKRAISGFYGTDLDRILRTHDINTLVVTGVITNFAVEGLVREGVDRGYHVIVLEDCCASNTTEMHNFFIKIILPYLGVESSSAEYIQALKKAKVEQ
jgi:nicotinamidase-related amidase